MKFLIINGPGLNLLRYTEQGYAGEMDYDALIDYVEACCAQLGVEAEFYQSNHEGDLIDEIQSAAGRADGIVFNPAGYAFTSVALLDALRTADVPAVEVLLDDPGGKEPFRRCDIVSYGCQGRFAGEGPLGYAQACAWLLKLLRLDGPGRAHIAM